MAQALKLINISGQPVYVDKDNVIVRVFLSWEEFSLSELPLSFTKENNNKIRHIRRRINNIRKRKSVCPKE